MSQLFKGTQRMRGSVNTPLFMTSCFDYWSNREYLILYLWV